MEINWKDPNATWSYTSPYAKLGQNLSMLQAPADAAPPKQVTTGEEQKANLDSNPTVAKAQQQSNEEAQKELMRVAGMRAMGIDPNDPSGLRGKTGTFPDPSQLNYGLGQGVLPRNAEAIDDYYDGLQQAREKDDAHVLSDGFNQRIYKILHGDNAPIPELASYLAQTEAQKQQTRDLGDGSKLMNPSDEGMNHEWDTEKLKKAYGFTDDEANAFKNQRFNWRAYNALVNDGIIRPTEAARQYQDYLDNQ